ncbi:hypothetical protein [Methylobacterium aquaticum]|uniref:hypothetical protein n=1 Tax=Methylobacterium aquaticum TaxID=270351 RepID=UPI0012E246EE|nr:hypothetical protein [Methylobacterium aquaticum]
MTKNSWFGSRCCATHDLFEVLLGLRFDLVEILADPGDQGFEFAQRPTVVADGDPTVDGAGDVAEPDVCGASSRMIVEPDIQVGVPLFLGDYDALSVVVLAELSSGFRRCGSASRPTASPLAGSP